MRLLNKVNSLGMKSFLQPDRCRKGTYIESWGQFTEEEMWVERIDFTEREGVVLVGSCMTRGGAFDLFTLCVLLSLTLQCAEKREKEREREKRGKRIKEREREVAFLLLPLRQLENSHLVIFRSPAVLSKKVYSISRTYACAFSPIDPASFLSCVWVDFSVLQFTSVQPLTVKLSLQLPQCIYKTLSVKFKLTQWLTRGHSLSSSLSFALQVAFSLFLLSSFRLLFRSHWTVVDTRQLHKTQCPVCDKRVQV